MNVKHIQNRIEQCLKISELSNCPRRKFGALLVDPENNVIVAEAWNGPPRGPEELCGGDVCSRDEQKIPSGTQNEVGCIHAESNIIMNAARIGRTTNKMWLFVNGEPCISCAKSIYQCGIIRVIVINGGYIKNDGCDFLIAHNVIVEKLNMDEYKDIGR